MPDGSERDRLDWSDDVSSLSIGALETQEFRTTPVPFWLVCFSDTVKGLGALLFGVNVGSKLKFAGRVGTGFSEKLLKALSVELNKIAVKTCPFDNLPATGRGLDPGLTVAEMKRCVLVKPIVVCEVKFTEWTRDDRLRHPVFLGLRNDKNSSEVVREKAS